MDDTLTTRLAARLKQLRHDRNWSLDRLTELSGISRASLSRLENADVSPTAEVLGKLCTVYALPMSRLLAALEEGFGPVVRSEKQAVWTDTKTGFVRRNVSPPAGALAAEVLRCELRAGTSISYDAPAVPGLEHHLVLLEGELEVEVEGQVHQLKTGDCLRYQLFGASAFRTGRDCPASYILVLV